EHEVPRTRGAKLVNLPGILLMEAAHRNGYHLLGEVLRSPEWRGAIAPSVASPGARAAALSESREGLGWGAWEVHSFVAGERLIARIAGSYEAVAHRRLFGRSTSPRCNVARGAAAAAMNLLYREAAAGTPGLSSSHYNELFRSPH